METKFNFNSQICTSREQSERLIALGLKKETADCGIYYSELAGCDRIFAKIETEFEADEIPAWSLHRLIEIIEDMFEVHHWIGFNVEKDYDHMIDCIEWLIYDNRFNKEYLEERKAEDWIRVEDRLPEEKENR